MSTEERAIFDLRYLLNLIWFNKLIILISVSSLLLFGLYKIQNSTPIFDSFVIFETDEKNSSPTSNLAELMLMQSADQRKEIPIILGREFLLGMLEDRDVKFKINQHCDTSFTKPSILSVAGLLDHFGVYKIKIPTEEQLLEKQIGCIRQMIIIDSYIYKDLKTDARILTVKSSDPNFSAFLANQIVSSYLSFTNAEKNKKYDTIIQILSNEISKVEQAVKKKEKDFNNFILENATVFGFLQNTVEDNESAYLSSLMASLANDMKTLRDLEEKLDAINVSLNLLVQAAEKKDWRNILNDYLDFSFSAEFEENMGRYNSMVTLTESVKAEKKQIIEIEKDRLNELRKSLKRSIAKVEGAINENTVIHSRVSEFNLELRQMREKLLKLTEISTDLTLEANYERSDQRDIHSIAVPAINPSSPKIMLIIGLTSVCGIFIALVLIVVKQSIFQNIYTANQMLSRYKFLDVVIINKKKLKQTKQLFPGYTQPEPEELALVSKIENSGNPIAFVEIGGGLTFGTSIVDQISLYFTRIMALKPVKVLLINRSQNINPDFLKKDLRQKDLNLGSYEASNDELLKIEENTLFPLEQKYDHYNKINISIDKNFGSVEKFQLINSCEKLVLVSKIGKARMSDYTIFFEGIENHLREKCLGLILLK